MSKHWLQGSPLIRHPFLLLRKIKKRFRPRRLSAFPEVPSNLMYQPVVPLSGLLRDVVSSQGELQASPPHNRVFCREFPIQELWRLCREGPDCGTDDLLSDIKLPWEFSRLYGFPLHALQAKNAESTAHELADFYNQWWEHNDNVNGVNWICAMEVAIRAVNLIVADGVLDGRLAGQVGRELWAQRLWWHGEVIWQRLEAMLKSSSNHYIADLLGLFFIGSAFPKDATAEKWRRFALKEMQMAILAQTYDDGGVYEASIPYHALVTGMALLFSHAAEAEALTPQFLSRLKRMTQIVADFTSADGRLFCVGDDDSGQIIALDSICPAGRGELLTRLAEKVLKESIKPAASVLYPRSGWAVLRESGFVVVLVNGPPGLNGLGGHAHADDLSVIVEYKGVPVLIDPGSGYYTSNPVVRERLRSAESHNTVSLMNGLYQGFGGSAQDLFRLPQKLRCFRTISVTNGSIVAEIKTRRGFSMSRTVTVANECLDVVDTCSDPNAVWSFVFPPELKLGEKSSNDLMLCGSRDRFRFSWNPSSDLHLERTIAAQGYGTTVPCMRGTINVVGKQLRWKFQRVK